jgi:hypothetical protein
MSPGFPSRPVPRHVRGECPGPQGAGGAITARSSLMTQENKGQQNDRKQANPGDKHQAQKGDHKNTNEMNEQKDAKKHQNQPGQPVKPATGQQQNKR